MKERTRREEKRHIDKSGLNAIAQDKTDTPLPKLFSKANARSRSHERISQPHRNNMHLRIPLQNTCKCNPSSVSREDNDHIAQLPFRALAPQPPSNSSAPHMPGCCRPHSLTYNFNAHHLSHLWSPSVTPLTSAPVPSGAPT